MLSLTVYVWIYLCFCELLNRWSLYENVLSVKMEKKELNYKVLPYVIYCAFIN